MDALTLEGVSHAFGEVRAVCDVSLSLAPGELVCLLGPSGCGKTTVLRLTAGLEKLQKGRVLIDGRVVADERAQAAPEARNVGLMFQDYALFPHLSAVGNVEFGLRRLAGAERRARAAAALQQVGMGDQQQAYPHTLSGGQQQRVALARALAPEPHIMLLDEPFSGLDVRLRNQIRDDALHVLKSSGAATLMVTHDPEEAMFMADRIAVMRDGRLLQVGPPAELYYAPSEAFVAGFFGDINRLHARVAGGRVATVLGEVEAGGLPEGTAVEVLIRPEALKLDPAGPDRRNGGASGTARVMAARLLGRTSLVHLSVDGAGGSEAATAAAVSAARTCTCTRACPGGFCRRRTKSCPFNWTAVRPLFLPRVKLNNSSKSICERWAKVAGSLAFCHSSPNGRAKPGTQGEHLVWEHFLFGTG